MHIVHVVFCLHLFSKFQNGKNDFQQQEWTYILYVCMYVYDSLQVNTTSEDGCNLYTCGVNSRGDLVLRTKVTTCPPFNRQTCLDQGVRVLHKLPLHPSISQHSHTYTYTSVLNPPLLFVFRVKSARSEQPAVRCVSRVVPSAKLENYFENLDDLILITVCTC